mmetsp:Transcript_29495/g.97826  ORF Transcript_29495/g.97826 Transcript_29495/m.97826 type:complete len:208 (-) Transcript_29495:726-1349(-)
MLPARGLRRGRRPRPKLPERGLRRVQPLALHGGARPLQQVARRLCEPQGGDADADAADADVTVFLLALVPRRAAASADPVVRPGMGQGSGGEAAALSSRSISLQRLATRQARQARIQGFLSYRSVKNTDPSRSDLALRTHPPLPHGRYSPFGAGQRRRRRAWSVSVMRGEPSAWCTCRVSPDSRPALTAPTERPVRPSRSRKAAPTR